MAGLRRLALIVAMLTAITSTAGAQDWSPITDTEEVRALITERVLLMYGNRHQYYRRDGNMVEYFEENDAYMVRKWKVREDGAVCWIVFSVPDRVLDCSPIQRGPDKALRYKWENAQSAPPIEVLDAVSPALVNELEAKAGIPE